MKNGVFWDVTPCGSCRSCSNIPEDAILHSHCCENLNSYMHLFSSVLRGRVIHLHITLFILSLLEHHGTIFVRMAHFYSAFFKNDYHFQNLMNNIANNHLAESWAFAYSHVPFYHLGNELIFYLASSMSHNFLIVTDEYCRVATYFYRSQFGDIPRNPAWEGTGVEWRYGEVKSARVKVL
jgi:hypothetical protein